MCRTVDEQYPFQFNASADEQPEWRDFLDRMAERDATHSDQVLWDEYRSAIISAFKLRLLELAEGTTDCTQHDGRKEYIDKLLTRFDIDHPWTIQEDMPTDEKRKVLRAGVSRDATVEKAGLLVSGVLDGDHGCFEHKVWRAAA